MFVCPYTHFLKSFQAGEGQWSWLTTLSVVIRVSVALSHGHLDRAILNMSPFKVFLLTVKRTVVDRRKQAIAQTTEQTSCHCHHLKLGVYLIL